MADTPSTGNATPNQATPNDAETAQSTEETVQLAVAAAVEIASPGRGAEASVTVEAGRTYTLVDPVLRFTQDGGDLVVHWRDGGHTTLEDYLMFAQTDLPPALTLADGTVISFDQLVASIEGFDLGLIAPAAAPPVDQSVGGAYNTPFDGGTLGPEHGIKALLLGTELQFGLIEGLDELPPDEEAVAAAVFANATVLLDDDALAGGNPGGTGDDVDAANTSGTLVQIFGAGGAASFAYLDTDAPAGFTYELSGGSLLVKQGGTLVLTVTLNTATGAYTVAQNATIDHVAGLNENNQVFTINYRVTDGDGNTVDGTLTVNVDDDTPVAGTPQTTILANSFSNSATADLDFSIGADAPGTFDLTKALATDGSQVTLGDGNDVFGFVPAGGTTVVQLTSDGTNLVWHENDGTGTLPDGSWSAVLTGTSGNQAAFEAATVFTVSANSDGTYTVTLDDTLQLDGIAEPFTLDFTSGGIASGNNDVLTFFDSTAPDVAPADGIPDGSNVMVVATATDGGSAGTVNSSTSGMGVQNNFVDDDDVLKLEFGDPVDPSTITGAGQLTPQFQNFVQITFKRLDSIEDAIIEVVLEGGGSIFFSFAGEGTGGSDIEQMIIRLGDLSDNTGGGNGSESTPFLLTTTLVDGVPTATGFVTDEFAELNFTAASGDDYVLLSAEGETGTTGFDIDTTFTATATDADGDSVDTTFDVNFISGTVLTGTTGSDVLNGNGDSETLTGGAGDDDLTGGTGDDTFVYTSGADGNDTILDYTIADDTLDLDALFDVLEGLDGAGFDTEAERLAALEYSDDGSGNLKLTIDDTGEGGEAIGETDNFSITFDNLLFADFDTALQNALEATFIVNEI